MARNGKRLLSLLKGAGETRTSIVADIDKYIETGRKGKPFSLVDVTEKIMDVLDAITEGKERDEIFKRFFEFYDVFTAPAPRAGGVFHPSQLLDGCERAMYYDLHGDAPTERRTPNPAQLQRTFDVGTWYHTYVQNILYNNGILEQAEVPVFNKERYINGSADGVIKAWVFGEKAVLEIKTMNSFTYSKAIFAPFKKHVFQASIYARELGIRKILFLYINKDTSEMKDFLVDVDKEELEKADGIMDRVIEAVEKEEAPKRKCKVATSETACSCVFRSLCFSK